MTERRVTLIDTAAQCLFVQELLVDFYSTQIDAGAVLYAEIATHIRTCAERAEKRLDVGTDAVRIAAEDMIARLPVGWAEGDSDWQEPA